MSVDWIQHVCTAILAPCLHADMVLLIVNLSYGHLRTQVTSRHQFAWILHVLAIAACMIHVDTQALQARGSFWHAEEVV